LLHGLKKRAVALPDAFFNFLSLFKIKGLPIGAETKKGRKRAKEALYATLDNVHQQQQHSGGPGTKERR
jgi:hypothetical protein